MAYAFEGPDEREYYAEMMRLQGAGAHLSDALKAKLSDADYALVRAYSENQWAEHLAELRMIQARLERRCPSLVDVIRESIIEGSIINYADVTVTAEPE